MYRNRDDTCTGHDANDAYILVLLYPIYQRRRLSPTRLALSSISKSHDSYSELWLWLVYRRANKRRRCICPFIYNYIYKICLSFNFLMLQKYTFFLKKTSTGHIFWLNRHEKAREQNMIPCASAAHTGASRKAQQVGKTPKTPLLLLPNAHNRRTKFPISSQSCEFSRQRHARICATLCKCVQ